MRRILLFIPLLAAGCASVEAPSAFLGGEAARLSSGKHFASEYVAPGANLPQYRKIQVRPVNIAHFSSADVRDPNAIEKLAQILKEQLEAALRKSHEVLPAGAAVDAGTLILEPALIQTSASYSLVEIQSVSMPGAVTMGSTTFEAKLTDADGRLLGLIAEKRKSRGRGLRLGDDPYVTRYPHAEAAFRKWAAELSALLAAQ